MIDQKTGKRVKFEEKIVILTNDKEISVGDSSFPAESIYVIVDNPPPGYKATVKFLGEFDISKKVDAVPKKYLMNDVPEDYNPMTASESMKAKTPPGQEKNND